MYEFFDERSASFFALGRTKQTKRPVVVLTTSGTAVAETLPAVIESYYSSNPLIILSSDRPKYFRKSGAPQSIEQHHIFNSFAEKVWDIDTDSCDLKLKEISFAKPLHINICFYDPMLPADLNKNLNKIYDREFKNSSYSSELKPPALAPDLLGRNRLKGFKDEDDHETLKVLSHFLCQNKNPLVIVSDIPAYLRSAVMNLLFQLNRPSWIEALSGLSGERKLEPLKIKAGEKSIEQAFYKKNMTSVIKIGQSPVLKFWRTLETKYASVPVFVFECF